MTTHIDPYAQPAPPAPDAVRYPYPSPRAYRVRALARELAAVCVAVLAVVLVNVPLVPSPVERECSTVTAYDSTGTATPVLGHWDAQGTCLPPCPTEDSTNCYWDASIRGNGMGRSFTVDVEGNVNYQD